MSRIEIKRPLFPPHYMLVLAFAELAGAAVIILSLGLLKSNISLVTTWGLARRWHRRNDAMTEARK